jgi:hypothetical protein
MIIRCVIVVMIACAYVQKIFKQKQVMEITTTYYDEETDQLLTIKGVIRKGLLAPPQNFDRFQEPDDPDEVELLEVYNEHGEEIGMYAFSESDIEEMENALADAI